MSTTTITIYISIYIMYKKAMKITVLHYKPILKILVDFYFFFGHNPFLIYFM